MVLGTGEGEGREMETLRGLRHGEVVEGQRPERSNACNCSNRKCIVVSLGCLVSVMCALALSLIVFACHDRVGPGQLIKMMMMMVSSIRSVCV